MCRMIKLKNFSNYNFNCKNSRKTAIRYLWFADIDDDDEDAVLMLIFPCATIVHVFIQLPLYWLYKLSPQPF